MTKIALTPTWVGEVSDTIGEVGANTTITATVTLPCYVPISSFVLVSTAETLQNGLSLGHAWISASPGAGTGSTLSYKVINATAGALTPTDDPTVIKVVVL